MSSIDVWNDGGSLAEDERAAAWNARLSAEAGRTLWCDVARTRGLLQRGLKPDAAVGAMAMDSLWNALGGLTLQLSAGQHGYYHVVLGLQHAPLAAQAGSTAWSVALGAPVQRPPDLVRNHVNNTREVLVQDAQHRLHLLASTGQVLWTRQLEGPILGRITQVDRFRNDKLQYLFNTANTVFLVDRNGKDVGGFPFTLKSPATAPLAVFDYENERDYRVLVPTADKRLVNLGLDGQVVKGWEAKPLSAAATGLVRHLRIKGRDHLVVPTADGKLHCLDRRAWCANASPWKRVLHRWYWPWHRGRNCCPAACCGAMPKGASGPEPWVATRSKWHRPVPGTRCCCHPPMAPPGKWRTSVAIA
jgi:hypothetical protein